MSRSSILRSSSKFPRVAELAHALRSERSGRKPYGGSNPSARTSSKGAVLLDCAWEVRADAGTGIQAALRAPCASVRVRIPVGTPQSARVVKLAATAVLNTAAFGRGSSSLLSRTGLWRCVRNRHRSALLNRTGNTGAELALSEANGFESCRLRQIVQRGGRVGKVTSPENWRALARATGGSIPSPSAKFPRARGANWFDRCGSIGLDYLLGR